MAPLSFLEQGTGIEPAFTAWEAVVLPIYEPCEWLHYSKAVFKKQGHFVAQACLDFPQRIKYNLLKHSNLEGRPGNESKIDR